MVQISHRLIESGAQNENAAIFRDLKNYKSNPNFYLAVSKPEYSLPVTILGFCNDEIELKTC